MVLEFPDETTLCKVHLPLQKEINHLEPSRKAAVHENSNTSEFLFRWNFRISSHYMKKSFKNVI